MTARAKGASLQTGSADAAVAAVRPGRAGRNRLAPPVQLTPLIERDLVLRSLDVARAGRLTQVIGPPGAGKTTVLAQWRRRLLAAGVRVAWYTGSEREREPRGFLHMLARALDAAGLDMAGTGLLDTPDADPGAALDAILLRLETTGAELVLVIDEYDRVETPQVAAIVEALVETAPESVHLALGARRRPNLAVSVLRAQGVVRTIDTSELHFTREELAGILDLAPDGADLEVVAERTEGWPVAVELYRLWRSRSGADDSLSALFSGRTAEVADYLTEQVFATLAPDQQGLLADLSIFAYVEPDLADHVRGRGDSAAQLRAIEAALPGLVEHGLNETEPVYRFHPLLVDYARSRAEAGAGEAVARRRRAAGWFERHGRHADAVQQLQAAGDGQALTAMMRRLRPLHVFLAQGAGELRAILRECPPDLLAAHPRLQLMAALAHFKSGFFVEATAMLEAVRVRTADFAREPFGDTLALQMEGRALELLFSAYVEGAETAAEPWVEALAEVSTDEPLMWAWSENIMIVIHEERGDLVASREAIARTRAIYRSHGMLPYADMSLINHDVLLALAQGQMREAAELAASARRVQLGELSGDVPVLAMARIAQAAVDYERRYAEAAADAARQGLEQFGEAETWGEPYAIAHEVIADVAWRRGGLAGLRRFVEEARHKVRRIGVRSADRFLCALMAGYLARAGELEAAAPMMAALQARRAAWAGGAPSGWRERDAAAVSLARWRLARGEAADAAALADELALEAEAGGRVRSLVKALVLGALAKPAEAQPLLARALDLGQAEGLVAVFAEEGEVLLPAIESMAADEGLPLPVRRHAEAVLRALNLGRRAPNALNEREAQIVAHLAEGASNKLIARRLGLTENTIKFHLKKVFAKLGVTSRKAAAAAARELAG